MWEPISFFVFLGLIQWARYEVGLTRQPPQHFYQMLDALQRHHPNTPIEDFSLTYR